MKTCPTIPMLYELKAETSCNRTKMADTHASASSALSSVRSSSPSTITSLRATCRHSQVKPLKHNRLRVTTDVSATNIQTLPFYGSCFIKFLSEHVQKVWNLTSSYLRSASSAMCLASFSWISWSSIFSSSFRALFSITFIPLHTQRPSVIYLNPGNMHWERTLIFR